MGRRGRVVRLRWRDVDLDVGAIEWGVDESARKSRAARRVVPAVRPLKALLKRAYLERGKPDGDQLVCPPMKQSRRGVLSTGGLTTRAMKAWGWQRADPASPWNRTRPDALDPIGLHECRHTAATWLDAAGVSPKVASVLMGHATPDAQAGAAPITPVATRTRCPMRWNGPAASLTLSSKMRWPRSRADAPLELSFPPGFPPPSDSGIHAGCGALCPGLENRCVGNPCTEGSNPSPSASHRGVSPPLAARLGSR
jgi:Phage integrase family